jgi:hypothetical protein
VLEPPLVQQQCLDLQQMLPLLYHLYIHRVIGLRLSVSHDDNQHDPLQDWLYTLLLPPIIEMK